MGRTHFVALPMVALLALSAGCGKKKDLDASVDKLVKALQSGEYAKMEGVATAGLMEDLSEEKFQVISQAVRSLGDLKDRTMHGIEVKSGAPNTGKYTLEFDKGEVDLEIAVDDGSIHAFELTGSTIQEALQAARNARFAKFEVQRFELLDGEGKPNARGNVYAKGTRVGFRLLVAGLEAKESALHLKAELVLKAADGTELARNPNFLDHTVPYEAGSPRVATMNGSFDGNRVGPAQIELHITDVHSGKTLVYGQGIVIE